MCAWERAARGRRRRTRGSCAPGAGLSSCGRRRGSRLEQPNGCINIKHKTRLGSEFHTKPLGIPYKGFSVMRISSFKRQNQVLLTEESGRRLLDDDILRPWGELVPPIRALVLAVKLEERHF